MISKEPNQFINSHTILGYLETINPQPLEVVKFKSKRKDNRQVFLISNNDCITIEKPKLKNKTINDLVIDNININQIGKIIIDNGKNLTVQKGRPYFFPKCKNEEFGNAINLKYKFIQENKIVSEFSTYDKDYINIDYFDITTRLGYHIQFLNICERLDFPRNNKK